MSAPACDAGHLEPQFCADKSDLREHRRRLFEIHLSVGFVIGKVRYDCVSDTLILLTIHCLESLFQIVFTKIARVRISFGTNTYFVIW